MIKTIITEIKEILYDNFGVDKCNLRDDLTLSENLAFDSLDRVDFIRLIEARFMTSINDYDAEDLNTLKDVVKYVYQRVEVVPEVKKKSWFNFFKFIEDRK